MKTKNKKKNQKKTTTDFNNGCQGLGAKQWPEPPHRLSRPVGFECRIRLDREKYQLRDQTELLYKNIEPSSNGMV